jgi:hypothetical protein
MNQMVKFPSESSNRVDRVYVCLCTCVASVRALSLMLYLQETPEPVPRLAMMGMTRECVHVMHILNVISLI